MKYIRQLLYVVQNPHPLSHWYDRWYMINPDNVLAQLCYVLNANYIGYSDQWYDRWRKISPTGQRYYDWVNSDSMNNFYESCEQWEGRYTRVFGKIYSSCVRAFIWIL